MMLLTAVTFGGQDALPVLGHLPDEEAAVLRHRAEKMLEIPRERRIPLLVQELKRLVTARKGHLWSAEPEALATLLGRERPAVRELILRALPVALADAARLHLPPTAVEVREELPPGVLGIVRWKLEGLLQQASAGALWKFSDLLMLKPRELYTLADRQGCRALATAIAALLAEEQAAFFSALPPELGSLAQRAVAAAAGRELTQQDARALLSQHGADASPLDGIRSAGIQRIARACLAQGPDFAPRLLERHRPPFAPVFQKWMNDERTRAAAKGDGGRAEIVADLERLEARELVEKPARLPAMSRKPVVPPPAVQGRARPAVPVPPAAAHRALPSEGMPVHERAPDRSRTPPVAPPAAARAEGPQDVPDWHAPPGTLDPRSTRALRTRLPASAAPVIAPLPQKRPGPADAAPEPAWADPPAQGGAQGRSTSLPAHERPVASGSPGPEGRTASPSDGRGPWQGAAGVQGGSLSPAERAGAQAPRSRQGGAVRANNRPAAEAGDREERTAAVPPPVADAGRTAVPRRASAATPPVDEKTAAIRPPRALSDERRPAEARGAAQRPLSAPIVGSRPGRTGAPQQVDPDAGQTQSVPPPQRSPSAGEERTEAVQRGVPEQDDDERTRGDQGASRQGGERAGVAPRVPSATAGAGRGGPDGSVRATASRQGGAADSDDDERTTAFRPPSRSASASPGEGADSDDDERTTAFRPPPRARGGAGGAGQRRGAEPPSAPLRPGSAAAGRDELDEDEKTAAFRPPSRPVAPPERRLDAEVKTTAMRPHRGDEAADEKTSAFRSTPLAPLPPGRGARSDEGPTGAFLPVRDPAPPRKGEQEPVRPDDELTTASLSAVGRPGPPVPPSRETPPSADDPATRTLGQAEAGEQPEPTEALSVPRFSRGSAGRVQGTAHLRAAPPAKGPVVMRPPQRRRSDSRIRKAAEPPIAPSPPPTDPAAAAPRTPRVVGSSTRHKSVKGPGRGPGGGTG